MSLFGQPLGTKLAKRRFLQGEAPDASVRGARENLETRVGPRDVVYSVGVSLVTGRLHLRGLDGVQNDGPRRCSKSDLIAYARLMGGPVQFFLTSRQGALSLPRPANEVID